MKGKCVKKNDSPLTQLEKDVERCFQDIESSSNDEELKAIVQSVVFSTAKEIDCGSRKAVAVFVPYAVFMAYVRKIQGRIIAELEKKLKCPVVMIGQRSILPRNYRKYGFKSRPRSRTLTAVHDALLEDICGPSDIVGKRLRYRVDGSTLLKVILDPKDKDKDIADKVDVFGAVYKRLTNKEAEFSFPATNYYPGRLGIIA
ncbi:40S ribosomal protein S7 [Cryptosporidium canis]|uniref:40S ribosomal protein S7 n=1 Tax=Cryptosporidium canis TaxID=195482 RepID=A0A9D5DHY4_9CRYT|nr:40S ribosomal protein S7 [Cryptosporidium canis]